jgi:hypothetical protein
MNGCNSSLRINSCRDIPPPPTKKSPKDLVASSLSRIPPETRGTSCGDVRPEPETLQDSEPTELGTNSPPVDAPPDCMTLPKLHSTVDGNCTKPCGGAVCARIRDVPKASAPSQSERDRFTFSPGVQQKSCCRRLKSAQNFERGIDLRKCCSQQAHPAEGSAKGEHVYSIERTCGCQEHCEGRQNPDLASGRFGFRINRPLSPGQCSKSVE